MSRKDKTREKLVGSMRKSKADAGIGMENTGESKVSPDLPREKPTRQAVAREHRRERSGASVKGDPYQSGRRIWPD